MSPEHAADLIELNAKFDLKIKDAEDKLKTLIANKDARKRKLKEYYEAIASKEKAETIISKGKPVI
jgi:pyruvate/2-oxoglutarate dehydrogenase complex dihydrolipoamide dehydrogenase (E3) component